MDDAIRISEEGAASADLKLRNAVAEAFWLEPENALEGLARLARLGYRVAVDE